MNHPHITFNTGRMYSEHGQRIAACVVGGRCYFIDIDRGIDGSFEFNAPYEDNLTPELVMSNYDHGNYVGMGNYELRAELHRLALEFKEK